MQSITAVALKYKIESKEDIQLVDVRESYEHDAFDIGGMLIPLGDILHHIDSIDKEKPVVVYCHRGIRSQIAIQRLCEKFPFKNLYNLAGGMLAWQKQFDV